MKETKLPSKQACVTFDSSLLKGIIFVMTAMLHNDDYVQTFHDGKKKIVWVLLWFALASPSKNVLNDHNMLFIIDGSLGY